MASSVFYRFKSNKDTTRITFDGTFISVFELKKAIIETSHLGDGTDFELILLSADEKEEYSDDTETIPRSTTVIARRKPAERHGRGGAARYVSGKAPTNSKNAQRTENMSGKNKDIPNTMAASSALSDSMTEKQREEAILKLGAEQWKQTQKEMASATRVPTTHFKSNTTNSNNPPPEWYLCNRCGIKGHWIKDCPQNGNPDFDDNRRIKKAIGIPRSRLVMIDKKTIVGDDGNVDVSKLPAGAMIDGDGNYVTVKADKATWNKLQEQVSKSAAAQEEEIRGREELLDRGLECSIDKRLFVDPVKTPCCQTTYCNECITEALLDDDLRCPNCGKDGVLIDDLKSDSDMIARIKEYQDEKTSAKQTQEDIKEEASSIGPVSPARSKSGSPEVKEEKHSSDKPNSRKGSISPTESTSKKRKADGELNSNRASPMPSAINDEIAKSDDSSNQKEPPRGPKAMMNQSLNAPATGNIMNNGFPMNMPVSMPGMNGMMPMMFDPMAMFNQMNAMNAMMGMNSMNNPMAAMNGMNGMNGMMNMQPNHNFQQSQPQQQQQPQQNYNGAGRGNNYRGGMNNQPYRQFNSARPNQEDSAYFRAPVNPHRNNRRNAAARPADYREI